MRAVLGIDAAWTLTEPSGIAVAVERAERWHLVGVAASCQRFQALSDRSLAAERRPSGSVLDAGMLLASASVLCGQQITLVAIDMPLARTPIVGRRICDNAVSSAYGSRKCGTHSPSAVRPGPVSRDLIKSFDMAGYPLITSAVASTGVIEVYPHPALVELARAEIRLPYKVSRMRSYWPSVPTPQRRLRLFEEWGKIVTLLEGQIAGVKAAMPTLEITAAGETTATGAEFKAYEDQLDAIVCTWVAVCALEGRAQPFGDENSAIWIPNPLVT